MGPPVLTFIVWNPSWDCGTECTRTVCYFQNTAGSPAQCSPGGRQYIFNVLFTEPLERRTLLSVGHKWAKWCCPLGATDRPVVAPSEIRNAVFLRRYSCVCDCHLQFSSPKHQSKKKTSPVSRIQWWKWGLGLILSLFKRKKQVLLLSAEPYRELFMGKKILKKKRGEKADKFWPGEEKL